MKLADNSTRGKSDEVLVRWGNFAFTTDKINLGGFSQGSYEHRKRLAGCGRNPIQSGRSKRWSSQIPSDRFWSRHMGCPTLCITDGCSAIICWVGNINDSRTIVNSDGLVKPLYQRVPRIFFVGRSAYPSYLPGPGLEGPCFCAVGIDLWALLLSNENDPPTDSEWTQHIPTFWEAARQPFFNRPSSGLEDLGAPNSHKWLTFQCLKERKEHLEALKHDQVGVKRERFQISVRTIGPQNSLSSKPSCWFQFKNCVGEFGMITILAESLVNSYKVFQRGLWASPLLADIRMA